MSNSVWPHRQQPTRLPCPWDTPGKNTGVGCHFLLQCMKVKSESEVAQSCPTLSDPMDCSLPGPSVRGIFQARVLEWGAIAFSDKNVKEKKKLFKPCYSECDHGPSSIRQHPGAYDRNADSQGPPHTYRIRICIWPRAPGGPLGTCRLEGCCPNTLLLGTDWHRHSGQECDNTDKELSKTVMRLGSGVPLLCIQPGEITREIKCVCELYIS